MHKLKSIRQTNFCKQNNFNKTQTKSTKPKDLKINTIPPNCIIKRAFIDLHSSNLPAYRIHLIYSNGQKYNRKTKKKKILNVRYIKQTFFGEKRRANQVENYDRSDHFKTTTPKWAASHL